MLAVPPMPLRWLTPTGYAGPKAGITSLAKWRSERRLCSADKAPQAKEQIT